MKPDQGASISAYAKEIQSISEQLEFNSLITESVSLLDSDTKADLIKAVKDNAGSDHPFIESCLTQFSSMLPEHLQSYPLIDTELYDIIASVIKLVANNV